MSYLGTLVNTPPVAAATRTAEPALEQHVEIESALTALPASVASEPVAAVPEQRSSEQARAAPMASVEDALRAALQWVTPRPVPPAIAAETEILAPTRSAALDVLTHSVAAPMSTSPSIDPPQSPQPLARHERAIAMPVLSQALERIDITSSTSSETFELTSFESTPTQGPKPRRRAVAAQRSPSSEVASAGPQAEATRPSPVQVRIGAISLNVRSPAPPAPAPQAAAPVFVPAAERPAASAPFAFSARRHHLRWG